MLGRLSLGLVYGASWDGAIRTHGLGAPSHTYVLRYAVIVHVRVVTHLLYANLELLLHCMTPPLDTHVFPSSWNFLQERVLPC